MDIVHGRDSTAQIHYRDCTIVAFDDKFGVSEHHIDVIPTEEIVDITCLTEKHIPLIEQLYRIGLHVLQRRNIPYFDERLVSAGYNYPVSVKQLHLHMTLPPYKHSKILQKGRWLTHHKVLHDLKTYGRVRLYSEYDPDASESFEAHQKAMENWKEVKQIMNQNSKNGVQVHSRSDEHESQQQSSSQNNCDNCGPNEPPER